MKKQIIKDPFYNTYSLGGNVERKGDEINKEDLKNIEVASEDKQSEKELSDYGDMEFEKSKNKYLEQNPGKTEDDFIREIIGLDLALGPSLSRENLIKMLESEFPKVYRLYKNNLPKIPTIEIKKMLDNLDSDRVSFAGGGNGHNSMSRSDFKKLPFRDRIEKMFGVALKGDETLTEIQIKIDGLKPILDLKD